MPKASQRRPRTEIIIAIAATVVSICAMVEEMQVDSTVTVVVQYKSLYGEKWELTYPTLSHRRIN